MRGIDPFFLKRRPLEHAKFMLLVNHGQSQPFKTNPLLNERVGANNDLRRAVGDGIDDPFLFGGWKVLCQIRAGNPQRLQEL